MEASKPAKPAPSVPARDETPAPPVATVPPPNVAERVIETSPGEVVHQVMPDVSDAARKTIRGKVKIQVRAAVDAAGHVTDAKVESQNSRYFAKLALDAARQWQFASGPGDYILRFEFTTAGSTVRPSRVGR
jgi:TonB family protein